MFSLRILVILISASLSSASWAATNWIELSSTNLQSEEYLLISASSDGCFHSTVDTYKVTWEGVYVNKEFHPLDPQDFKKIDKHLSSLDYATNESLCTTVTSFSVTKFRFGEKIASTFIIDSDCSTYPLSGFFNTLLDLKANSIYIL